MLIRSFEHAAHHLQVVGISTSNLRRNNWRSSTLIQADLSAPRGSK